MATMKDVAKRAGTSVATVSRFINKSGYVSKEAQKNVQKAIDDLNYTPNEVARSLYQKKSKFIGILLPDITNPFVTMLSKGIEDHLSESDYGLILANVGNDPDKEAKYLTTFRNNNVAGIISAIEHKTAFDEDVLHVSIDRPSPTEKHSVLSDDYKGGQLTAREIAKRTTKDVFILNSTEHLEKSHLRMNGMRSVFDETGHVYHVHDVPTYRPEEAEGIISHILEVYPNVDSVIAANDIQAMVLIKEASEQQLIIPDDLQIMGYDDITYSKLTTPGISTIAQPIYEMGIIGAELLLRMIHGERISKNKIVLPVEFIERGTLRKLENLK